jgi:3',5'-nucleoside bisphosphate phosphatase
MAVGLRGIEVYRPRNRRDQVLRLEQVCRSTGLFATGGSDWHGPHSGSALGDFFVTGEEVSGFLDAGGL